MSFPYLILQSSTNYLILACSILAILSLIKAKSKLIVYIIVLLMIGSLILCRASKSLLIFIIGLELYSILYIIFIYLTSKSIKNTKKLLIITMVIDAIMAYGISLINNNYFLSHLLITINILFKLGATPFCAWIVDIYPKISKISVLISDSILKFMLIANILIYINPPHNYNNYYILSTYNICGILSIIYGIIKPFFCSNIKQFLGLINIGHTGIILLILENYDNCNNVILTYSATYSICSYFILFINKYSLKLQNNIITLLLFAITGLPPFHTFLAKVGIFQCLASNNNIIITILIICYFIAEMIFILRFIMKNMIYLTNKN